MPGKDGMEQMQAILTRIRTNPPSDICGHPLVFDDFKEGLFGLPKSDVLRFKTEYYRIIVRPSGTEPKMKIYLQTKGKSDAEALSRLEELNKMLDNELL